VWDPKSKDEKEWAQTLKKKKKKPEFFREKEEKEGLLPMAMARRSTKAITITSSESHDQRSER